MLWYIRGSEAHTANPRNAMLKFSNANAKIEALGKIASLKKFLVKRKVFSLDLLSGYSCPYAKDCLSKVVEIGGKRTIKDGPDTVFRCFSASQEAVFPAVYNLRKHNFDTLRAAKTSTDMCDILRDSLPPNLGIGRIHVGGDFFNRHYMMAWAMLAEFNPSRLFYAYTKSLPFWIRHREYFDSLPNFILTASYGGRHDHLIEQENLRFSKVVNYPTKALRDQVVREMFEQSVVEYNKATAKSTQKSTDLIEQANKIRTTPTAECLDLDIDHDDSHAADPTKRNESFALLIHGTQPKGSDSGLAMRALKKNNVKHTYNRKVTT